MHPWPARAIRVPVRKMTRPGEVGALAPADDQRRWLIAIVIRSSKEVPVQSHRRLRRTRIAATSLVIAALAAPAANARVALDPPAAGQAASAPERSTVVVSASPDGGFDWGSAGIGAAAGAGLVLVGAGSFALTHRGRLGLAR
jgi:hypothetical protein